MDTTSNNLFSLTQLSKSENTVVFKESNVDDLFQHIKNEPKHGPRVVVFDLDSTLKSHTRDIETLNIIQKLQADRCLVIGLVAKRNMLAVDTTIKEFLALGLNLNQRFFKNTHKVYKNSSIAAHVFQDGFLFVSGGPTNYKKALNKLIKDFQLNYDDVYFIDRSILPPIHEVKKHSEKKMTMFTSLYDHHILKQNEVPNAQNTLQDAQRKIVGSKKRITS